MSDVSFDNITANIPQSRINGANPSLVSWAVERDSTAPQHAKINTALAAIAAAGGGRLLAPRGNYRIGAPIVIPPNVHLEGEEGTTFTRVADMPDGWGVLNLGSPTLAAERSGIQRITVDGQVSTPVGILNPTDPLATELTRNSSIRIHSGARKLLLSEVEVVNTGGYAVLGVNGIKDVRIDKPTLRNNRPHTHGTAGDQVYGGWTGSIFFGSNNGEGIDRLQVTNGVFERLAGHGVWTWGNQVAYMHKSLIVSDCQFELIGLDGILIGNADGATVKTNIFRKHGFVTYTNSDAGTPRWNASEARLAVCIDSTGVKNFIYGDNVASEVNGEFIDLDGASQGVVSSNSMTVSPSAGFGPGGVGNRTKGIQTAASYFPEGGDDVTITSNNLVGTASNAIALVPGLRCLVSKNTIRHENPVGGGVPIMLANHPTKATAGNIITHNTIFYSGGNHCVVEAENVGLGNNVWNGEQNFVYDNPVFGGNYGEFLRAPSSGSVSGKVFSTNSSAPGTKDEAIVQREGRGANSVLKTYTNKGGVVQQSEALLDGGASPVRNVSKDGQVGTGALSTGDRLTIGVPDSVNTGVALADGMLVLGRRTFSDAQANAFNSDYVLVQRTASGATEISEERNSSGARVWKPLASSFENVIGLRKAGAGAGIIDFFDDPDPLIDHGSRLIRFADGVNNGVFQLSNKGPGNIEFYAETGDVRFLVNSAERISLSHATGQNRFISTNGQVLVVGSADRINLDQNGNNTFNAVGNGVGQGAHRFVRGATERFVIASNGDNVYSAEGAGAHRFFTGGLERANIASDGSVTMAGAVQIQANAFNALDLVGNGSAVENPANKAPGLQAYRATLVEMSGVPGGALGKSIIYMRDGRLRAREGTGAEQLLINAASAVIENWLTLVKTGQASGVDFRAGSADFDARIQRDWGFNGDWIFNNRGTGRVIIQGKSILFSGENGLANRGMSLSGDAVLQIGGGGFGAVLVNGTADNAISAPNGGGAFSVVYATSGAANAIKTTNGGIRAFSGFSIGSDISPLQVVNNSGEYVAPVNSPQIRGGAYQVARGSGTFFGDTLGSGSLAGFSAESTDADLAVGLPLYTNWTTSPVFVRTVYRRFASGICVRNV